MKIAVLAGSLRKESYCRKVALELERLAPESFEMKTVDISGLAMYNQDLDDEGNPPDAWKAFRKEISASDALLFITPEYNRSVPAVLKNAVDVGSRPYGKSVWNGKPGAIISVTPGSLGAFGANHHLRQSFVFLNIPVMQQPEAYISNVSSLFDENGNLVNENTRTFLKQFMDAFASWAGKNAGK